MTATACGKFYFFDLRATENCVSTCKVKITAFFWCWSHSLVCNLIHTPPAFVFFLLNGSQHETFHSSSVSLHFEVSCCKRRSRSRVRGLSGTPFTAQPSHNGLGSDWEERAGNRLFLRELYGLEAAVGDGQCSGCLQRWLSAAH